MAILKINVFDLTNDRLMANIFNSQKVMFYSVLMIRIQSSLRMSLSAVRQTVMCPRFDEDMRRV